MWRQAINFKSEDPTAEPLPMLCKAMDDSQTAVSVRRNFLNYLWLHSHKPL